MSNGRRRICWRGVCGCMMVRVGGHFVGGNIVIVSSVVCNKSRSRCVIVHIRSPMVHVSSPLGHVGSASVHVGKPSGGRIVVCWCRGQAQILISFDSMKQSAGLLCLHKYQIGPCNKIPTLMAYHGDSYRISSWRPSVISLCMRRNTAQMLKATGCRDEMTLDI